jgi:small conductance mechanosensitive channel
VSWRNNHHLVSGKPQLLLGFVLSWLPLSLFFYVGRLVAKGYHSWFAGKTVRSVDKAVSSVSGRVSFYAVWPTSATILVSLVSPDSLPNHLIYCHSPVLQVLAVGLALPGSLANFASGILIILFQAFLKPDFIDGGGVTGTVENRNIPNPSNP